MSKTSIFAIVSAWSEEHGDRFRKAYRKTAIEQLVLTLIEAGYDEYQIKNAKSEVMKRAVGKRSKFGSQALQEWKEEVSDEFDRVWAKYFEKVDLVDISKVPKDEEKPLPIQAANPQENSAIQEFKEFQTHESVDLGEDKRYAPEMDRSKFQSIETTPVESVDEFMAKMGLK